MCEISNANKGCWNCNLYDICNRKYYVTNVCELYEDCRTKNIDNNEV